MEVSKPTNIDQQLEAQIELSCSISHYVERTNNVTIFNLTESSHNFKQHDCTLINKLCEFILNRKLNVSFNRLGPKPDNNGSMPPQPVKIKLPDIVTKRKFMKYLIRMKNSPVEFHNFSVKHDMTIDERAKKKIFMGLLKKVILTVTQIQKTFLLLQGPLWDQKVVKVKKKKKVSPVEETLNS